MSLAEDHDIVVVSENVKFLLDIFSTLEAQRLVELGYEAYLAYLMNLNMNEVGPQDIRTV